MEKNWAAAAVAACEGTRARKGAVLLLPKDKGRRIQDVYIEGRGERGRRETARVSGIEGLAFYWGAGESLARTLRGPGVRPCRGGRGLWPDGLAAVAARPRWAIAGWLLGRNGSGQWARPDRKGMV